MRHMVPFYKKTAFPRGWEGWCWWPGCTGERVWGGSRGGHLPTSSVPGQALGSTAQEEPCTHPWRFSVSVGSAPGLLGGFNPQPPWSKEASGLQAWLQQHAQVRAQPLQKDLCPWEWVWAKHWLCGGYNCCGCSPSAARDSGVGGLGCRAQPGNVLLPGRSLCLSIVSRCTHTFSYSAGKIPLLMI